MNRPCILIALLLTGCFRGDAQPTSPPQKLGHYEIRADQLPKPYHTESSGNPPMVGSRPAGAPFITPPGFKVTRWADGFTNPRNMVLAPNGDVFLADTGGSEIVVFRDTNGDGHPDKRWTFHDNLNTPFGMAFGAGALFVGNTNAIVRFAYKPGQTKSTGEPATIFRLPPGGHRTRNLIFNRAGTKLYVATGSNSNASDESDQPLRAAVTELNPDGTGARVYASGLRNPIGLARNPANDELWTVVNERDGLGDDLVPDYATALSPGAFFGWPFSYIGKNPDPQLSGHRDLIAKAVVPSVQIQAHSAPITIAFYNGKMFPASFRGGAFVTLHGSWNRSRRTGYKVIHIPFRNGRPSGGYDDFILGWVPDAKGRVVWGRPAGLLVLPDGSLLVSDDGANVIWRVTYG